MALVVERGKQPDPINPGPHESAAANPEAKPRNPRNPAEPPGIHPEPRKKAFHRKTESPTKTSQKMVPRDGIEPTTRGFSVFDTSGKHAHRRPEAKPRHPYSTNKADVAQGKNSTPAEKPKDPRSGQRIPVRLRSYRRAPGAFQFSVKFELLVYSV